MIEIQKELKNLEEGKEEFLIDCKIRNLSAGTIKNYDECFGYFIAYINKNFTNFKPKEDMKKQTLDGYINEMKIKGIKDSTINIRIRAIRCVLYYFMRNEYIDNFKISQIKENDEGIELYTDKEIEKLLKKPNMKKCSFAEYRNHSETKTRCGKRWTACPGIAADSDCGWQTWFPPSTCLRRIEPDKERLQASAAGHRSTADGKPGLVVGKKSELCGDSVATEMRSCPRA